MNCRAFEELVEIQQMGTISTDQAAEMNAHLDECPRCRSLIRAIGISDRGLPAEIESDFSRDVLAMTSGPACRRAEQMLPDFVDAALQPTDQELIANHLRSCEPCAELECTLRQLAGILPGLAETSPPHDLSPAVLDSIRLIRSPDKRFGEKVREFIAGLLERPRFTWEAAYLGTLLVCAIFGTPFSPVHNAGPRLIAALNNQTGLVTEARGSFREWQSQFEIGSRLLAQTEHVAIRFCRWSAETEDLLALESSRIATKTRSRISSTAAALQLSAQDVHHRWKARQTKSK